MTNDDRSRSPRRAARRRRRTVGLTTIAAIALGLGSWSLTRAGAEPGSSGPAAATKSRIEACMQARGEHVALDAADPMVLSDRDIAERYGYGISVPILVRTTAPSGTDSVAAQRDLGACADAVRPDSVGDRLQAAYGRLAATISADGAEQLADLDQFVATLPGADAALSSWQKCVAALGYDFEDPGAARRSIEASFATLPDKARTDSAELGELQAAERALASADVTCRETQLFPRLIEAIDSYVGRR